jgi:hypothetical protein
MINTSPVVHEGDRKTHPAQRLIPLPAIDFAYDLAQALPVDQGADVCRALSERMVAAVAPR